MALLLFKSMYPRFLFGILIIIAVISPRFALASFLPGETLDPSCLPTDPTCVVVAQTTTNITPGSDATLDIGSSTARFRDAYLSGTLTATSASTTNFSTNNLWIGSITGILHAVAGVVSTTLINLTSDVTGVLPVTHGGTGWTNVASGAIPYGNGSGALATTTAGTAGTVLTLLNGVPTWSATTTFASPLSYANGVVSIPSATLSTNGYLTATDWATFNGKFATTSTDYWLTTKNTSNLPEGSNLYFSTGRVASVIAGTTTDALTQGLSNKYYTTNLFATDLAGTTTTSLTEGTNKYYTDVRVGSYISGSSTIPHIGGTGFGDLLSWTGSTWTNRATSTLGVNFSDTFGTLSVNRGGTNATSYTTGTLLSYNGTSFVSTTTIGNNQLQNSTIALSTGSTGADINVSGSPASLGGTLTLNIPSSSASNRGLLTSADWSLFNNKISSSSLSATFPLVYNSSTGVFSMLFSTTTANSFNALQIFGAGYIDNASSTHTAFTQFANASTTQLTNSGTTWLTSLASAVLAVDNTGKLVATTSIGTNLLSGTLPVGNGGTGVTSFGQGWIYSIGDGNALAASTSPTVNYITATSTTATSTFANGVNITGGCFAVSGTCIGNVVKLTAIRSYVANTTWSKPSNLSYIVVEVWGAGGGGGDGDGAGDGAGGGGAGGYSMKIISAATLTATTSVLATVGAGGGINGNAAGSAGGSSSFDSFLSATGGAGGGRTNGAAAAGGTGGAGSSGDINIPGQDGFPAQATWGAQGGTSARGGTGGAGGGTAGLGVIGDAYGGGGGGGVGTGAVGATGGVVIYEYTTQLGGSDLAENYPVSDPSIEAGDIVAFDSVSPLSIKRAVAGEDRSQVGIISTRPGIVLGDKDALGQRPVALSGRVPVKISLENGPIAIGDRIALSSLPGVGKKASTLEASVGIALEAYTTDTNSKTIEVFMDLQHSTSLDSIGRGLLNHTSTTSIDISAPFDFVTSLYERIKIWFADTANGITDFFAKKIHTEELCVKKSDGNEVCITGDQLQTVLTNTGGSDHQNVSAPVEAPPAPVIINTSTTTTTLEATSTSSDPLPTEQSTTSATTTSSDTPPDPGRTPPGPTL